MEAPLILLKLARILSLRLRAGVDTGHNLNFTHDKLWTSPFPSQSFGLSLFIKGGEFG